MPSLNWTLTDLLRKIAHGSEEEDKKLHQKRMKRGEFKYIPMNPFRAEKALQWAEDAFAQRWHANLGSFLEVGCGLGIVTSMMRLTPVAVGIDIDARYVRLSKKFFCNGGPNPEFVRANALTFKGYGEFDLIYFYQPFSDHVLAERFQKKLLAESKGLILASYDLVPPLAPPRHDLAYEGFVLWDNVRKEHIAPPKEKRDARFS